MYYLTCDTVHLSLSLSQYTLNTRALPQQQLIFLPLFLIIVLIVIIVFSSSSFRSEQHNKGGYSSEKKLSAVAICLPCYASRACLGAEQQLHGASWQVGDLATRVRYKLGILPCSLLC